MKAVVKIGLIVLVISFVLGSTAFLLPSLSQTTIASSANGTVTKGSSQASITVTLIDETEDYGTLLVESGRLGNKKVYKSNVFTEGNLPLAISYSGSLVSSTETLDSQKIQELVKNNIKSAAGDISRLKSVEFETITNVTFMRQVSTGAVYVEEANHTGLNLTEYDNDTLLIANATDQALKPKIETFRFFLDQVNGWYTDNISRPTFAEVEDWKYDWGELKSLSSLELSKDNKFFINVKGRIIPSEEPLAVDVYPTVKIGTIQFDFPEFSWWNASCGSRYRIISNATKIIAISVNDTVSIKNHTIWTENVTEPFYAYFEGVGFNTFCGVANQTDAKNWQNESSIANNNSAAFNTSGTPAVYHFGENAGTTSVDSTENTNDLTLNNASWSDGVYGKAMNRTYATASDHNTLDVTTALTITLWVYPYTFDSSQSYESLVEKAADDCDNYNFGIRTGTTNALTFLSGNDCDFNTGTTAVVTGQWQHVAMVFDGTNVNFYVDGTAAGSATTSLGAADANSLNILRRTGNSYVPNFKTDEVRIYNRTLSSAEIQGMYWNGIDNLTALGTEEISPGNYQTEEEGISATEAGIKISFGNDAVIYTDQQIYARYLNGSQKLARFDKVTEFGGKIWAFNYFNDSTPFTGMQNITPSFYVFEMANKTTYDGIRDAVSNLINQTKT